MKQVKKGGAAKEREAICTTRPVRLKHHTVKKLQRILEVVNKKDFGKTVRPDGVIDTALSLVGAKEIEELRHGSMSNGDRFERMYRDYIGKGRVISKDAFLGKILAGELLERQEATAVVDEGKVVDAS